MLGTRGMGPGPSLTTGGMGPFAAVEIIIVQPGGGALVLTGHPPTLTVTQVAITATPGAAELTLTGHPPALTLTQLAIVVAPGVAELTLTGYPPTVTAKNG